MNIKPFTRRVFIYLNRLNNIPPWFKNNCANTKDTMVINFINIFNEGPDVSLNGSPTVSPTTAA